MVRGTRESQAMTDEKTEPVLLHQPEMAKKIGVSTRTLRRMKVPVLRLSRKLVLYDPGAVIAALRRRAGK